MLAIGRPLRLEGRAIGGTQRSAVFVKVHISGRQISAGIEWNNGFLKAVIMQQEGEIFIAVESGISGKDAVMKGWMRGLKIKKDRLE